MKPPEKKRKKPDKTLLLLASRIRRYRLLGEYTQADIAEVLGISQPAYERKESGFVRFKREEIEVLTAFLGVFVWELFWDEKQQKDFATFAHKKGYISKKIAEKEKEKLILRIQELEQALVSRDE